MEKQQGFHYSVTELGNIQVRLVTKYIKNSKSQGNVYGEPKTPADTNDMTGWDDKSKDIVSAITDSKVKADFAAEKQAKIGIGVEEVVTYDRVPDDLERISVRRITRIFDDGKEVSKKYHRTWIMPGDDPSNADVMSKALAEKLHTPTVIVAYEAFLTSQDWI